jgi:type I restriction enzyme M protein
MKTQDLANVYSLAHDTMRNTDGVQPQDAFDEMLKYLFYRQWAEVDKKLPGLKRSLSFSGDFMLSDNEAAEEIRNGYRNYIGTYAANLTDGWRAGQEISLSDDALLAVHALFDGFSISDADYDFRSTALRTFLKPDTRRGLGIYLTPDEVVRAIIEIAEPKNGSVVYDPACGAGTFLTEVKKYWAARNAGGKLIGSDVNSRMVLLSELNIGLVGPEVAQIFKQDGLTVEFQESTIEANSVDYIFTNPPFGVYVDPDAVSSIGYNVIPKQRGRKGKLSSEVLFIERCLRWLKPGGLLGIVLPRSIITNERLAHARATIDSMSSLEAVVNLPPETFALTGTQSVTSILFLKKHVEGRQQKGVRPIPVGVVSNLGYDNTGRTRANPDIGDVTEQVRIAYSKKDFSEDLLSYEAPIESALSTFGEFRARGPVEGVRLGDYIADARTGKTPARKDYVEDGAFTIKVGNLTGQGIDWIPRDRNFVNRDKLKPQHLLEKGDIVLTSSAHNKKYIAQKVDIFVGGPKFQSEPITFVGEVMRVRVKEGVDPFLVLAWLRSREVREAIQECVRGQTAHLHGSDIMDVVVPERYVSIPNVVEKLKKEAELSVASNELRYDYSVDLGNIIAA